jgi:hypothetical protein
MSKSGPFTSVNAEVTVDGSGMLERYARRCVSQWESGEVMVEVSARAAGRSEVLREVVGSVAAVYRLDAARPHVHCYAQRR